jgi:glutathione S-transferase
MLALFGNLDSGNVHKVQMILYARGMPFRRVDVRQDRGQPRDARFLALNPMGKVPAVQFDDGDMLSDSGALLFHFADGTHLWPSSRRAQAEVLRWMFFEQYSHEPALAVLRYVKRFMPRDPATAVRVAELEAKSRFALGVLESELQRRQWIAGTEGPTIADMALYPYTRLAPEVGLEIRAWPGVAAWLGRVEALPRHLPLYTDGAREVIGFEDYFAGFASP